MEYNKEIKQEEIPEFALQPARPAETEVLTEKKEESFDASAYDKLFEEMARLKESFAEEVRKGNAEIEAQEAAARAGWEEPAFEEAWTVRDDGIEFCIKISFDFQRNGHVCG